MILDVHSGKSLQGILVQRCESAISWARISSVQSVEQLFVIIPLQASDMFIVVASSVAQP
jgi:hypothetical protein